MKEYEKSIQMLEEYAKKNCYQFLKKVLKCIKAKN